MRFLHFTKLFYGLLFPVFFLYFSTLITLFVSTHFMSSKKIFLNTVAQIGGKVATAFISMFLLKVLTNALTLQEFGLYGKVYNFLSVFATIADLGLYTVTIREISEHRDNIPKVEHISGNVLSIRTLSGIAIIFLSVAVAYFLPGYNSPLALWAIAIAGVFTLFGLLTSSITSVLQAYLKTEFSFFAVTIGKIINFATILAILFLTFPHNVLVEHPEKRS